MAQSGYTPLSLYYSATASTAPLAANLVAGELALNTNDGKLYYKDSSGVVQVLATKAASSGSFGALTATSIIDSGLTSGRVTYATTGGLLTDSANMTFNGTTFTTANDASISGLTVGKGGGSVSGNTALGLSSLPVNTTGSANTASGNQSLFANTTGNNNTAFGSNSVRNTTTSNDNTGVGYIALYTNTTGASNTAIGSGALQANTTASNNTAVGYQAGYSNTTGLMQAFGIGAGRSNTTGEVHGFGRYALYTNTTGNGNSAFGNTTLFNNSTGNNNSAFGDGALNANTTASNNTAVGYQAGYSNTTGDITAVGYIAGKGNTTGTWNTAVGNSSLQLNTTGNGNTALGYIALQVNTTGAYNTAIGGRDVNGYGPLANSGTGNYNIAVGNAALANATASNQCNAVGFRAGYLNTGSDNCFFGYYSGFQVTSGNYNTYVGNNAGPNGSASTGSNNVALGYQALTQNTTASNNTAVGYQAGYSTTTGQQSTFIGQGCGYQNTTGGGLCFIGTAAGFNSTASNNTAVGYYSLYNNTSGTMNTAIGGGLYQVDTGALGRNTTGSYNTALGHYALFGNTTASNNTAVGYQAGYANQTGTQNVYVGYQAGLNATGSGNTFVGTYGSAGPCGGAISTGAKNTILGGYNGNQGGLDIRTSSNYIVLSDGDGNPRGYFDNNGFWIAQSGGAFGGVGYAASESRGIRIQGASGTGATSTQSVFYSVNYSTTAGLPVFIANWSSNAAAGIGPHSGGNDNIVRIGQTVTTSGAWAWNGTYCNVYAGAYTNASDYRIKENVKNYDDGALEKILALRPVTYNIISPKTEKGKQPQINKTEIGFIAHEIQQYIPEIVIGEKDAINEDGSENHQAVDYSKFTAVLTKAIQELKAEFDAYKATHP